MPSSGESRLRYGGKPSNRIVKKGKVTKDLQACDQLHFIYTRKILKNFEF
jgi:HD-GYP domain-containing protein (c-di-GMP phosphodiesterase class II)